MTQSVFVIYIIKMVIIKAKTKEIYDRVIKEFPSFPKNPNSFLIFVFIFILFPFAILKMSFLIIKECLFNRKCNFKNMILYLWEYSHIQSKL